MRTKKLTGIEMAEVEILRRAAFGLTAKQQFRLAFLIGENIGYWVTSKDPLSELSVNGHPLAEAP